MYLKRTETVFCFTVSRTFLEASSNISDTFLECLVNTVVCLFSLVNTLRNSSSKHTTINWGYVIGFMYSQISLMSVIVLSKFSDFLQEHHQPAGLLISSHKMPLLRASWERSKWGLVTKEFQTQHNLLLGSSFIFCPRIAVIIIPCIFTGKTLEAVWKWCSLKKAKGNNIVKFFKHQIWNKISNFTRANKIYKSLSLQFLFLSSWA